MSGKRILFVLMASTYLASAAHAQTSKSALAYCKITGATGYGQSRSVEQAMENAINDCVRKGGIPACCRVGARLSSPQ